MEEQLSNFNSANYNPNSAAISNALFWPLFIFYNILPALLGPGLFLAGVIGIFSNSEGLLGFFQLAFIIAGIFGTIIYFTIFLRVNKFLFNVKNQGDKKTFLMIAGGGSLIFIFIIIFYIYPIVFIDIIFRYALIVYIIWTAIIIRKSKTTF